MTEADWLACTNFLPLLRHLKRRKRSPPSLRRWRLFACACCRHSVSLMNYPENRSKVEAAERHADGEIDDATLLAANDHKGFAAAVNCTAPDIRHYAELVATDVVFYAGNVAESAAPPQGKAAGKAAGREVQTALLTLLAQDVFGNPFQPVSLAGIALGSEITTLASAAYQQRHLPAGTLDPVRPGILADALEEAGCIPSVVEHLRSPGPHVRGCWAVDAVLSRS